MQTLRDQKRGQSVWTVGFSPHSKDAAQALQSPKSLKDTSHIYEALLDCSYADFLTYTCKSLNFIRT